MPILLDGVDALKKEQYAIKYNAIFKNDWMIRVFLMIQDYPSENTN